MVVTVIVPNINNDLACLIRNRCQAVGMTDYAVVDVHWASETYGFFNVSSGKKHLRMGFELSEPYFEWNKQQVTVLEITR